MGTSLPTVVVKLGGCNGSGKTSVGREVIKLAGAKSCTNNGKIVGYQGSYEGVPVFVMGRYETACGGMDSINNKETLRSLFEHCAEMRGIVFGEGLIFGKTYGYVGEWLMKNKRKNRKTLWAFMGTPFDECAERVEVRRLAAAMLKGKEPKPFDPERTMRLTYTIMERLEAGVRDGKYPIDGEVMRLEYKPGRQPGTHAKQLLKKALEMYHAHG